MFIICLSAAWVLGVYLGSVWELPPLLLFGGLLPWLALLRGGTSLKLVLLVSLSLFALVAGAARFEASLPVVDEGHIQFYRGQVLSLKGMASADSEAGDRSSRLRLTALEIEPAGEWKSVSGDVLLYLPRFANYRYGDILAVRGKVQEPPRLGDFDYPDYLAHQGIYATVSFPAVEVLERGQGNKLLAGIYSLRGRMGEALGRVLPEPQAALAQGMVLGMRGNIPDSLRVDLSRTGTAHILAISGMHIGIFAGLLVAFGVWLFGRRRNLYIWLALAAVWFYAVITGLEAPVMRAAIMASLFLAAELLGRQRSGAVALALAAAVMVGLSPPVLFTASFQLSFLAMAGVMLIAPALRDGGLRLVGSAFGQSGPLASLAAAVSDGLAVSLGAITAVYPLVAYYFGVVSLVSPLATLLAVPALGAIMVAGLLTGVLGLISGALAWVAGWLAWLFLSYLLVVVKLAASVPSFIEVRPGQAAPVFIYYSGLALLGLVIIQRRRLPGIVRGAGDIIMRLPARPVMLALAVLAALSWSAAAAMPDDRLHVSFLDVGEGDAILLV